MKINTLLLAASCLFFISANSQAEILSIGKKPSVAKKVNTPQRGNTMKTVMLRFGKAKRSSTSKGKATSRKPRITRWEYPKFTVYFEKKRVIHTVVHAR